MATPTTAQRSLLAAAAKKGSAWGTAVAVGATDGLRIIDDGGLTRKQDYLPAKEADTPVVVDGNLGQINAVEFAPTFSMRYDPGALGRLIAGLFGTAGAPTLQGTTAYKHTIKWADHIEGKFFTFAIERPGKIHEVASAKPVSLDFTVADGMIRGAIGLRGNTLIDSSAVNQAAQVDAVTYADRFNRVAFKKTVIKMNDQTGADVSGTTALVCNNLAVSYKRTMDSALVAGVDSIIEPLENDHPTYEVKLEFPRMNTINAAYFATFTGETTQKMLIKATGALIETTYYYDLALYFPRLRITEIEYKFDPIVPSAITLVGEEADTLPTGMTDKRPYIELVNKQTSDYLA